MLSSDASCIVDLFDIIDVDCVNKVDQAYRQRSSARRDKGYVSAPVPASVLRNLVEALGGNTTDNHFVDVSIWKRRNLMSLMGDRYRPYDESKKVYEIGELKLDIIVFDNNVSGLESDEKLSECVKSFLINASNADSIISPRELLKQVNVYKAEYQTSHSSFERISNLQKKLYTKRCTNYL